MSRRTRGVSPFCAPRRSSGVVQDHFAELRFTAVEAAGQPEAGRKRDGGVVDVCGELVEDRAEEVHYVLDCRLEQLVFRLKVVVEGADPNVRGLSDLQHRRVGLSSSQEGLCRADQRGASLRLPSMGPGWFRGRGWGLGQRWLLEVIRS